MSSTYQYLVEFSCPESFLPDKKVSYRLSRYALSQTTSKYLGHEEIEIENFDHLLNSPTYKVSISHTSNAGAAIISLDEKIRGIGIDIEWEDRVFKAGVEKFYVAKFDDATLNSLELWCAKEAAYKAFFPHYRGEKVLVLKDFTVKESKFYINEKYLGDIAFNSIIHENKKLLICTATLLHT